MKDFNVYEPIWTPIPFPSVKEYELYGLNGYLHCPGSKYYRKRKHLCKR